MPSSCWSRHAIHLQDTGTNQKSVKADGISRFDKSEEGYEEYGSVHGGETLLIREEDPTNVVIRTNVEQIPYLRQWLSKSESRFRGSSPLSGAIEIHEEWLESHLNK